MDNGQQFLRLRRISLMGISVSQVILGLFCVFLWSFGIVLCRNYEYRSNCNWTTPLQGIWGGSFVFLSGTMGIGQALRPSMAVNLIHLAMSMASLISSLGLLILELGLLINFINLQQNEIENNLAWSMFNWCVLVIASVCVLLSAAATFYSAYAQCGCFGTYCDTEEDRSLYVPTDQPLREARSTSYEFQLNGSPVTPVHDREHQHIDHLQHRQQHTPPLDYSNGALQTRGNDNAAIEADIPTSPLIPDDHDRNWQIENEAMQDIEQPPPYTVSSE